MSEIKVDYEAECNKIVKLNLELRKEIEDLKHEVYKKDLRIDACLFSMVMLQSLLKAHQQKDGFTYKANLNEPDKIWLAE
jgi:hypothetical protein